MMRRLGFSVLAAVLVSAAGFAGADTVVYPLPELEGLVGRVDAPDVAAVDLGVTFSEIHSVRIACWGSISPGLGCGDGVERPVIPYYHIPGVIKWSVNAPAAGACSARVGPYDDGFFVEEAFECTDGADWDFLLDGRGEVTCYVTTDLIVIGGVTLSKPAAMIYGATLVVEGTVEGGMFSLDEVGKEYLPAGSTHTITWADPRGAGGCEGSYFLDYSIDGGANWIAIEASAVSGACAYEWIVPEVFSDQCRIRISDGDLPWVSDATDGLFGIYVCQGPLVGDFDGSCYVDMNDFGLFAPIWGENLFGLAELVWMAESWLACGNPYDPMCQSLE